MAVDHHDRARFHPDPARGVILQPTVNGQPDRISGDIVARFQIADDPARGGDLDPARAGHPAQFGVVALFKPILADLEARRNQQRIVLAFVFLRRGWPDIADQDGPPRGRSDTARAKPRCGLDAGQIGGADADRRKLFPVETRGGQCDRLKAVRRVEFILDILNLDGGQRPATGQARRSCLIDVDQPFRGSDRRENRHGWMRSADPGDRGSSPGAAGSALRLTRLLSASNE